MTGRLSNRTIASGLGSIGLFIAFGIGPNSLLAVFSIAVLAVGLYLLWHPYESPILIFIFVYQWLQASVPIFEANFVGRPMNHLAEHGGRVELAAHFMMVGLLSLAVGMRLGSGRKKQELAAEWQQTMARVPFKRWFSFFVGAWFASNVVFALIGVIPGVSQLLIGFSGLKWAAFFLLTYSTLARRGEGRALWLAVFLVEFFTALGAYFSSFKHVFVFTILAVVVSRVRLTFRQVAYGVIVSAIVICLSVIWTGVKIPYRHYVTSGRNIQSVEVGYQDRLAKLAELASALDGQDLTNATEDLVHRIGYLEFFGVVLRRVPSMIEHQRGQIWLDAATRPFRPRILFPGKSTLDDSAVTNYYTGLGLAGERQGASISIGYMGESYIDFGATGMIAPIFAVGLLIGYISRWLRTSRRTRGPIGIALSTAVLFPAAYAETSAAKIVGALFAYGLAAWLASRFIIPAAYPWIVLRRRTSVGNRSLPTPSQVELPR